MMRRAAAVLPQRVGASMMLATQARASVSCLWWRREAASFASAPCDRDAAAMEMLTSSTAGRGFFATRHIRAGERILTEAPIVSDNLAQLAHVRMCVCVEGLCVRVHVMSVYSCNLMCMFKHICVYSYNKCTFMCTCMCMCVCMCMCMCMCKCICMCMHGYNTCMYMQTCRDGFLGHKL